MKKKNANKVITIADDLTGANVNAALLASHGFSAATCTLSTKWKEADFEEIEALSINTGSRQLSAEKAYEVTKDAIAKAFALKPQVLAKRIDSTLRGHLGIEIEAALEVMPENTLVLLCPSFPASGRIAAGGHLIVDGLPLERTDAAKDPIYPMTTSQVIKIFQKQSSLSIELLPLDVVLQGTEAITKCLQNFSKQSVRVVACDALTDENIQNIAKAATELEVPVLCADSGPLCAEMAVVLSGTEVTLLENRVFAVVGSVMDIVRHQLDALVVNMRTHLICVNAQALIYPVGHVERENELARLQKALMTAPEDAQVLGLCTARHEDEILDFKVVAKEHNISVEEVSLRLTNSLAEVTFQALNNDILRLGGVFSSGGEVTMAVSDRLGAQGFSVRSEVLSRAMYGRFIGGQFPNMPMVTKGGFVGDVMAIVRCAEFLLTKISSQSA